MTKVKETTNWEVTCNRYVAFIDIMGFKNLVENSTHDEIYEMMKKIKKSRLFVEEVKWSNKKENLVKSTTYSDSIIMYSKDDSHEAFDVLCTSVASLSYNLFLDGIPFKGAIAFGMMTLDIDNSIFFGRPLIDAYLLQEEIYFYGVILHSSVDARIHQLKEKYPPFSHQYLCPLKGGLSKQMTIYPMFSAYNFSKDFPENLKSLKDAIANFRHTTPGNLRRYVDNTENYIREVSEFTKPKKDFI